MMTISEQIRKMKKSGGNTWRPENPEDYIAGEAVSGLRTVDTKIGERLAIDIRSEEDGEIYTVWAGTVIANELTKKKVQVGDQVGIKFLGMVKNYKDYVVHVEKNGHEPGESSPPEEEQEDGPWGVG